MKTQRPSLDDIPIGGNARSTQWHPAVAPAQDESEDPASVNLAKPTDDSNPSLVDEPTAVTTLVEAPAPAVVFPSTVASPATSDHELVTKPEKQKENKDLQTKTTSRAPHRTKRSLKRFRLFGLALGALIVSQLLSSNGIWSSWITIIIILVTSGIAAQLFLTGWVFNWMLPVRFEAPDKPPTSGFKGYLWKYLGGRWFYLRSGLAWLVQPGLRERLQRADDDIWALRDVQKIWAFMNSTGKAGKTQAATYFAAVAATALKRSVCVMDLNESPGGSAPRLGVELDDTILIRPFLKRCAEFVSQAKFSLDVGWQRRTGVFVIAAEEEDESQILTRENVRAGIRVVKDNCLQVMCDLGNGIPAAGNLAAFDVADILVFPVSNKDSHRDLPSNLRAYSRRGYGAKLEHAILVVFGAKQNQRAEIAARYELPVSQVFVVEQDPYMQNLEVTDLQKLKRRSRVVLYEAVLAGLQAPMPEPFIPSDEAPAASDPSAH
jgi:hypothetical protein